MAEKKQYDLELRTELYAKSIRVYLKTITKSIVNMDDIKQVVRSSGSVAANYMEANDSLSDKDFVYRIKICRKEAKETRLWFRIINVEEVEQEKIKEFEQEAHELMNIFGAILRNFKDNRNKNSK
ncbi:MAG: four helix bundle protein [Chitinophagales bacterium]